MTDQLAPLGKRVEQRRIDLGWSKEHAARQAGISAITWKRVEDGLSVHDTKRAAVLRVLGLDDRGQPVAPVGEPAYVAAPGDKVMGAADESEVLREIRQMREELRAVSERLANVEQHRP